MIRRILLWLAVGPRTFRAMQRSVQKDTLRVAHTIDILIRKDSRESRVEADWLKDLATVLFGPWRAAVHRLPPGKGPEEAQSTTWSRDDPPPAA